jgi:hypothetical protein
VDGRIMVKVNFCLHVPSTCYGEDDV